MESKFDELNEKTKTTTEKPEEKTKSTTANPQESYYPWESPVCKDKSDSCESFKPMCSLFR